MSPYFSKENASELGNLSFKFIFGSYSFLICYPKFSNPFSSLPATFTLYTILEMFSEMSSKYLFLFFKCFY